MEFVNQNWIPGNFKSVPNTGRTGLLKLQYILLNSNHFFLYDRLKVLITSKLPENIDLCKKLGVRIFFSKQMDVKYYVAPLSATNM